jgi:hypothetical protein
MADQTPLGDALISTGSEHPLVTVLRNLFASLGGPAPGSAQNTANHQFPSPAIHYPWPQQGGSDEDYYNAIRNTQGSDAADAYLKAVYKNTGYQKSDPINGIPRSVQ